ncbi:hypothetical protein ACLBXB_28125 [Methylobacterium mesophilicum]
MFSLAKVLQTRFMTRVQTDRLAKPPPAGTRENVDHRVFGQLNAAPWLGPHSVTVSGSVAETVCLRVKFAAITTTAPSVSISAKARKY